MAPESRRTPHQVTFTVLAAGVAAYALLQSLVTPVLSTIAVDLHTTQNTVTWVLTAYLLSASIFTPIMGRIGDIVGKERIFVLTLIALSAGLSLVSPFLLRQILDHAIPAQDRGELTLLVLGMVAIAIATGVRVPSWMTPEPSSSRSVRAAR